MNSLKTLSFTAIAALATAIPANAYFRAGFKITKEYQQGSSGTPTFIRGNAYMYVVDGTLVITAGCAANGADYMFPVDTMIGCNIGANGVVMDTIVDAFVTPYNSGLYDQAFYEIVGLEPATVVEPGRPELVKLQMYPISKFPPNSVAGNVGGVPTSVFYDLQTITGDLREYRLAGYGLTGNQFRPGYSFRRMYTSRKTMEEEIVEGVYQFAFPTFGRPNVSTYLSFPVKNTVEGYVKEPIKGGFRFTNVGPFGPDGFAQYDPRVSNTFTWEGLTANLVTSSDRLYIGFRRLVDQTNPNSLFAYNNVILDPTDPLDFGQPIYDFPPPTEIPPILLDVFPGSKIRLPSPVQSSYTLPAGFFKDPSSLTPFFARSATMLEITLQRDPGAGLGIVSDRKFFLPIKFVNTFAGFMAASFPANTASASLSKDADPDGDGISNWVEWLSGSNPALANAPKTLGSMSFVPPSQAKDSEPSEGFWQMSMERPTNLDPLKSKLIVEASTNLTNWAEITESDPQWKVIDNSNDPQIRVISKTPGLTEKRYFRVKFNYTGN